MNLVRALLAANAHNAQPWLFVVTGERIEPFADMTRTPPTSQVTLTPTAPSRSALFDAIAYRHTDRGEYDTSLAVTKTQLDALGGLEARRTAGAAGRVTSCSFAPVWPGEPLWPGVTLG